MAAVEVTITGTLYDKLNRTTQQVVLIGEASLTGLGIGGGPMPPGQGSGGSPPGIWGPNDPRPSPPIHLGPGGDVGGPPVIGGGPIIPDTPKPPDPTEPPVKWKSVWAGPEQGWVVVGVIDPDVKHPVPSAKKP